MCGIAGCYQQADGQKLVDVMSERIAHRGRMQPIHGSFTAGRRPIAFTGRSGWSGRPGCWHPDRGLVLLDDGAQVGPPV